MVNLYTNCQLLNKQPKRNSKALRDWFLIMELLVDPLVDWRSSITMYGEQFVTMVSLSPRLTLLVLNKGMSELVPMGVPEKWGKFKSL